MTARVNSEQVTANSERRVGNVVVLPKVWAVGEKKPCGSVGNAARGRATSASEPFAGSGASRLGTAAEKQDAGISPLRCASVEMTERMVSSAAPVETISGRGRVAATVEATSPKRESETAEVVEVAFYRKYTEAMLRRYAVMSLEAGRVPSMLGREMFRGKVTNYKVHGFDDVVNFCLDVESCLRRMSSEDQVVLKRVAVQRYTHGEAASLLGVCLRTCITRYNEAIDRLTKVFLKVRLLEPQKSCQEASRPLLRVSSSN